MKQGAMSVKLVRVIKEVSAVGAGTKEDPVRERTQYWGLDGTLLFAIDSANLENSEHSQRLIHLQEIIQQNRKEAHMQGQDYTKLIELSKQVAKELKNYHPHMSVVITADYIRADESVIGVPIDARSDKNSLCGQHDICL
mgnify:CR=1 FL=1